MADFLLLFCDPGFIHDENSWIGFVWRITFFLQSLHVNQEVNISFDALGVKIG